MFLVYSAKNLGGPPVAEKNKNRELSKVRGLEFLFCISFKNNVY